jgi:hypothetical protein
MKNKKLPEKTKPLSQTAEDIKKLFDYPKDRPNPLRKEFSLKDFLENSLDEDTKLISWEGGDEDDR